MTRSRGAAPLAVRTSVRDGGLSTAFPARPPDLPPRPLMVVDFAISCSLVRPGRPRYPVLVHRAAVLLHASFRPRLAATPLRFANPSPPSGWAKDFHLQAVDHARHTTKCPARGGAKLKEPAIRPVKLQSRNTGRRSCAGNRDRGRPRGLPLPHHRTYGSVYGGSMG
jgi:hypothetical protein